MLLIYIQDLYSFILHHHSSLLLFHIFMLSYQWDDLLWIDQLHSILIILLPSIHLLYWIPCQLIFFCNKPTLIRFQINPDFLVAIRERLFLLHQYSFNIVTNGNSPFCKVWQYETAFSFDVIRSSGIFMSYLIAP